MLKGKFISIKWIKYVSLNFEKGYNDGNIYHSENKIYDKTCFTNILNVR